MSEFVRLTLDGEIAMRRAEAAALESAAAANWDTNYG